MPPVTDIRSVEVCPRRRPRFTSTHDNRLFFSTGTYTGREDDVLLNDPLPLLPVVPSYQSPTIVSGTRTLARQSRVKFSFVYTSPVSEASHVLDLL